HQAILDDLEKKGAKTTYSDIPGVKHQLRTTLSRFETWCKSENAQPNLNRRKLLEFAMEANCTGVVEALIENNPHLLKKKDVWGRTPLMAANHRFISYFFFKEQEIKTIKARNVRIPNLTNVEACIAQRRPKRSYFRSPGKPALRFLTSFLLLNVPI